MPIVIKTAYAEQEPALDQLLTRNHLSADDLPSGLPNFWLAFDNEQLIGSIGIEAYGDIGLLRSVCVDNSYRNQGIARQLCGVACQEARQQSINTLYLLTTTADHYFERIGFTKIGRNEVPEFIQQTTQFSSLCPSSAIVMKHTIQS